MHTEYIDINTLPKMQDTRLNFWASIAHNVSMNAVHLHLTILINQAQDHGQSLQGWIRRQRLQE